LDFGQIHSEPIRPYQESQIFNRTNIKRAFFTASKESMLSESLQDWPLRLAIGLNSRAVNHLDASSTFKFDGETSGSF
jgi:hypothetical protein